MGSGLHVETLLKLKETEDPSYDYEKAKYCTSMTLMKDLIFKWVENPEKYNGFQGAFGTMSAISRREIQKCWDENRGFHYNDEMQRTCMMFNLTHYNVPSLLRDAMKWAKIN